MATSHQWGLVQRLISKLWNALQQMQLIGNSMWSSNWWKASAAEQQRYFQKVLRVAVMYYALNGTVPIASNLRFSIFAL